MYRHMLMTTVFSVFFGLISHAQQLALPVNGKPRIMISLSFTPMALCLQPGKSALKQKKTRKTTIRLSAAN